MKKVLLLTDSCSLPRSFPKEHAVRYEETYPYLLRKSFPSLDICNITLGGATSSELIGQAASYFDSWQPDIIIVHAGIVDCRPEPVSQFFRLILTEFEFMIRLKAYIFSPFVMRRLIRFRAHDRVSIGKFQRNIKKLKSFFTNAKILWLEISTTKGNGYDDSRPGIIKRISEYNSILAKNLKDGFVHINNDLNNVDGVNSDHIHLNKNGHAVVHSLLKERIIKLNLNEVQHEL